MRVAGMRLARHLAETAGEEQPLVIGQRDAHAERERARLARPPFGFDRGDQAARDAAAAPGRIDRQPADIDLVARLARLRALFVPKEIETCARCFGWLACRCPSLFCFTFSISSEEGFPDEH